MPSRRPIRDDPLRARRFVICGKVLPGHQLEVRDEAGSVLADRAVGRIFVKGPSVMPGYFGEPEASREVLSPDGWLDTGDLGYMLDGEIVVTGRAKDLIIVNGRNVWPQDIEWAIEARKVVKSGDVGGLLGRHAARASASSSRCWRALRATRRGGAGARCRRRRCARRSRSTAMSCWCRRPWACP